MFKLLSLTTLALSTASAVLGVAIPRADAPSTYNTAILEPYATYNQRYLALDCEAQHDTQFFTDCCHPLEINQALSSRPAYCTPANASSTSSAAAQPTETGEDCEDGEEASSAVSAPSSTHVSASHAASAAPVNAAAAPPAATSAATTSAAATSAAATALSGIDAVIHDGQATWFYQNGVAGACGTVHADTDTIVALDTALYGDTGVASQYCGKSLIITNNSNGKQVTATVADACPTCASADSIDLSQGAFEALDALSVGEFDVSWHFTD